MLCFRFMKLRGAIEERKKQHEVRLIQPFAHIIRSDSVEKDLWCSLNERGSCTKRFFIRYGLCNELFCAVATRDTGYSVEWRGRWTLFQRSDEQLNFDVQMQVYQAHTHTHRHLQYKAFNIISFYFLNFQCNTNALNLIYFILFIHNLDGNIVWI